MIAAPVTALPWDLPKSWCWVSLNDVAETASGGTPSRTKPEFYGGSIPWIKSGELRDRTIFEAEEQITEQALSSSSAKLFPKGTLCIALYGATVGRLGILGIDAATNQAVCGIFLHEGLNSRFIFHFLEFQRPQLIRQSVGGAQPNISQALVRNVLIPLAPSAEQNRILGEIEKQFTRLDAAVGALKRAKVNLKRYRASVLKAACEGRLVPTEAELARREGRSYEPADKLLARILKERRARWEANQHAKLRASGKLNSWKQRYAEPSVPHIAGLPEPPEGWIWSSIGQLFEVCIGATPRRSHLEFWNGDVPWVSSGEVAFCRIKSTREGITLPGLENSSTELHPPGTVLLGMIGEGKTRGQAAILEIEACNNQNAAAIRVSETEIPSEYVYYFLQERYEETRRMSSGGNQPALNKERVRTINIPLPPLAEQKRIVIEVERRLSVIDELEAVVEANLKRAERLHQSILKQAFEGKLVPQDPNDEPASALLERIKAERVERAAGSQGGVTAGLGKRRTHNRTHEAQTTRP